MNTLTRWARTQPQDNHVHVMTCGHELDSATELAEGTQVTCSAHGPQSIAK